MCTVRELLRVIRLLRRGVYAELPIQQLEILCEVWEKDGITLHELRQITGMTIGSISRNVRMLSLYAPNEEKDELKGWGLLEPKQDVYHRKRIALWLTPKGKQVFKDVETLLQGKTKILTKVSVEAFPIAD